MFATLNHHQPHNRKTEQWQITRAFLVRLAISMHCCANYGGKIFGRKSIFVSRLTTWLLQIYNMKQTTLSLTFPSVLFKFFSSKGKTAMFSCFQTALSQKWMTRRTSTHLHTNHWKWPRKGQVWALLWTVQTRSKRQERVPREEKVAWKVKKALEPVRKDLALSSFLPRWRKLQWKFGSRCQVLL